MRILLLTLFLFPFSALAASGDILINEIAWMGTTNSVSDEWLELKNTTGQDIDLTGWILKSVDGTPDITLAGIIPAQGFFLLERTDDSSAPNVVADQIYTGALGNSGENLELRNSENSLIDSVNHSEGWTAGDNTTKQTMELISGIWQTSLDIGGTPKAQNSGGSSDSQDEDVAEQTDDRITGGSSAPPPPNQPPLADAGTDITALVNQELNFNGSLSSDPNNDTLTFFWNFGDGATDTVASTTHTYLYPGQYLASLLVSDGEFSDLDIITINIYSPSVIISEFIPNPEGKDESEWIEIFNQSDQVANLTNWQLDDQIEGSSAFIFPANSLIGPKQFLVLRREITKLALNNDSDQVRLIYPDGSVGAEVSYLAEKKEGFSIAFDGLGYFWTKTPTPGAANIISSGSENQENFTSNNPKPIVKETQETPEVLATTNLTNNQGFDTQNPSTTSVNNLLTQVPENTPQDIQSASLVQKVNSNQKANLILYLSIIISASLLTSWIVILVRKRLKFH